MFKNNSDSLLDYLGLKNLSSPLNSSSNMINRRNIRVKVMQTLYTITSLEGEKRRGQVIVCEGVQADWLPFKPLTAQRTNKKMSGEVIWTNHKSNYDNMQQVLF